MNGSLDLPFKHRLILPHSRDRRIVSKLSEKYSVTKDLVQALPIAFVISFMFALALLGTPHAVHAGIFSFVSDLLGGNKEVYKSVTPNLQHMALLQATVGLGGSESEGGAEITIVDGTALLPEGSPSNDALKETRPHSDQISLYVVRKGDNLSQIAEMFGVTTNTIRWSNDVKGNVISEGQVLVILPVSGVRHTVKKGDTVSSIAKLYKADALEVASYNNLAQGDALAPGEIVIVPDGEIKTEVATLTSRVQGANAPSYSGYYIRPISGGRKSQGLHGYNGIDLASPVGTPIIASASGDVIVSRSSGWNGGYGSYIVIAHGNGTQTLYAHNSENLVFQGDHVVQGQVIGFVGSTGKSTGPHVHFEIRGAKNPF